MNVSSTASSASASPSRVSSGVARAAVESSASTSSASTSSSSVRVDAFDGPAAVESESERNRRVVDQFYTAFERKDGAAMTAAYAPNATFSDPVFPNLTNGKGAAMWRMLCQSEDLRVRHEIVKVDGNTVTAKWIANYSFNGRPIENHVTSTIKLENGKIVDHRDSFDMKTWLRQAYGFAAKIPLMDHVLGGITRHVAGAKLDKFIDNGG